MKAIESKGMRVFKLFNYTFLSIAAASCIIPFLHVIAVSFSSDAAVAAGLVNIWPRNFTVEAYNFVLNRAPFWVSFLVSIKRVTIGSLLNMFLVLLLSYPLPKPDNKFKHRSIYVWIFFPTMIFSGGLVPFYILISELKLIDNIWALILPTAVNTYNIILMLNFFKQIPAELEEAAFIDGAGHWKTLWSIYVPVSVPAIATIFLFCIVYHWNEWFQGLIFMNNASNYPLQTYLQRIIIEFDFQTMTTTEAEKLAKLNERAIKSTEIIVASIPILLVYPFLQKYFVAGIKLGSVKG